MLTLEIAKNAITDRLELTNYQVYPVIIDAQSISYWNSDAREYMGKKENKKDEHSFAATARTASS